MTQPTIKSIQNLSKEEVDGFLRKEFPIKKAAFLINHGEWLHRGNENRFVLVLNKKIIGYFGIIPFKVHWKEELKESFWWTDLIISENYRGRGYQSIVDKHVCSRPELKLGFPNKIAAKIHQKHHWKIFDHIKVLMFPIKPSKSSLLKKRYPIIGLTLDLLITPLINVRRKSVSKWSYREKTPRFNKYVQLFNAARAGQISIKKDLDYFNWRYLKSPYRDDYEYYLCHKPNDNQIVLILRKIKTKFGLKVRIVDMFGNLEDLKAVKDIMNFVIFRAIKKNANQITIMQSHQSLHRLLFSIGFIIFSKARLCLSSENNYQIDQKEMMSWSLSDSDNDFSD